MTAALGNGRGVGMGAAPVGTPAYLALHGSGQLGARARLARARLRSCALCPRECRVDRIAGDLGECRTGALARVAGFGPHFGEEAPLVGRGGSGTIFFVGCNLACVFCQNHTISQPADDVALDGPGECAAAPDSPSAAPRARLWEVTPERLAAMMLELQAAGCENINFVSPSHVVPQILEALVPAVDGGLHLPLVYNTGGYDALETLRLLDGVVDIYMPDMKYSDDGAAERLSGVPDYVRRNREAVLEMHRQVGDLELRDNGPGRPGPAGTARSEGLDGTGGGAASPVARRGLLVRHLVLPGGLAGTDGVAAFLATEVSRDTYINVMDQYHPAHKAARYPEISRRLTAGEYREAVRQTLSAGLWRLDGWEIAKTDGAPQEAPPHKKPSHNAQPHDEPHDKSLDKERGSP